MLKRFQLLQKMSNQQPAAFRRLCVETQSPHTRNQHENPAAFRRLCVETYFLITLINPNYPAAFRRLCVETLTNGVCPTSPVQPPSGGCVLKLICEIRSGEEMGPAAFRRLCVETTC